MNITKLVIGIMLIWGVLLTSCASDQLVEPAVSESTTVPDTRTPTKLKTAVPPTEIPSTATATMTVEATAVSPTITPSSTKLPPATTESQAKDIVESDAEPIIIYGRSGGYAGIEEEWQIYGDGRITNNRGQTWQTTAQDVAQLLEEITTNSFFELEANYIPKNSCCDFFTYELTVNYAGETIQVTTIDGAPNTPDSFWETQKLVQEFIKAHTT